MAEPIKSVLLVDYESLQRSLVGTVGESRLAERSAVWLAALEAGRLGPDVKRKLMVKRCYASQSVRGKQRDLLVAAGFEMVEAADAGVRSSADLHMAMDTIDALAKPEGYQEFILLSAAELAPLLSRLKASKRVSVIYADPATSPGDRNLADAIIETADLVRILTGEPTPVADISVPAGAASPRADIEAFARRIHAATSIPLFSPKTFAELFRHLTEEIASNGYHFQTTARNVADRMVASGRNVTRRQVVFIVKGLALKGHVFSTNDTAEKLAEVFREQAHYLITNAGITLNQQEEDLLTAWFQGRAPSATGTPARSPAASAAAPAPARPQAAAPAEPEAPSDAKATIAETIEREVAKAVARPAGPERVAIKPPQPQAPAQAGRQAPAQPQKPPTVKVELPKSTARPTPFPSAREEAKAVIAARIAGAARMKPAGTRTPIPAKPAPKTPAPPAPAAAEPEAAPAPAAPAAAAPTPAAGAKADALENSILAAIAEAVDVLVEDSNDEPDVHQEQEPPPPPPPREVQGKKRGNTAPPPPRQPEPPPLPEAEEDEPAESNDIGDQIQRIIASYNRNRSDE